MVKYNTSEATFTINHQEATVIRKALEAYFNLEVGSYRRVTVSGGGDKYCAGHLFNRLAHVVEGNSNAAV